MLGCTAPNFKSFPSKVRPLVPSYKVKAVVASTAVQTKPSQHTLYQVLRINHTASQAEIKATYRSLAKLYHPDATTFSDPNGTDFKLIHEAYATLSDPVARATYDMSIGVAAADYHFIFSASDISRFRSTRRWETDQCW